MTRLLSRQCKQAEEALDGLVVALDLEPPGTAGTIDHRTYAAELAGRGYGHWVSLEMKEAKPFSMDTLAAAVRKLKEWYG